MTPDTITVQLHYFAKLGEDLGCTGETLQLRPGTTIHELVKILGEKKGRAAIRADHIRCAINQTIINSNPSLHDGDEIAFFPPVTGG